MPHERFAAAGSAGRGLARVALAGLLLLASRPTNAAEADHPLQPPDRSSPRATLATFDQSFDRAWLLFSTRTPGWREAFIDAASCLDVSETPAALREATAGESTLLLREVLGRIALPPPEQVPGADDVADGTLARWTIPHTEIVLARVAAGEREGEFLFTPATVAGARRFYEKVRHLPYQPGRQGAHYDELRFGGLSPALARLAARLPSAARREVAGALVWQWGAVLASLALALAGAGVAFRLGRRLTAWEERVRGGRRFGTLLFPLSVIALALATRGVAWMLLRLASTPYHTLRLCLTAIAHLAAAWLIAVVLTRLAELVARVFRTPEQPLNAQLVGVSFRILTILAVTGYLFVAAQWLGLPVPALVAGLGVGGLAVALATQGTLENLIGGLILYADRPVRVGDVFRLGDRVGVVLEIGMRSTRIRTLDRSIIAIPNSDLVRREIENLTLRDQIPLRARLRLRIDTTPDQLRYLLATLERMLQGHEQLGTASVRFVGFGDYSLDVDLRAVATTAEWERFLTIREDVMLRVMTLVEDAGTRLAVPAQLELTAADAGLDPGRTRAAEAQARGWRDEAATRPRDTD